MIDHLVDGSPNLIGLFWFNDETQSYLPYDPDFALFNNLETVESQQIFWLRLRAPQHFLGKTRPAGWSVVALPWRGGCFTAEGAEGAEFFWLGLLTQEILCPLRSLRLKRALCSLW